MYLFLEDYSYLTRTAKLICGELDNAGRLLDPRTIVEPPYHISYPGVFSVDGQFYMIPETAAANRVELYRAVRFPWEWKLERILVSGMKLQDPTYVQINGEHWIFAGGSSGGAVPRYDLLHLFHAANFHDEFRPHPGNPVKQDAASTRPAGRIFFEGNRLIRPAQDCSRWYGCGLTFMEVDALDGTKYSEHPVSRLPDCWLRGGFIGTHTYNSSAKFEALDVCTYGVELMAVGGRARSLLRKLRGVSGRKTIASIRDAPAAAKSAELSHP